MSALIEYSRTRASTIVTPASRYIKQNVIYYGEQRLLTFDSYFRQNYTPTGDEQVMVISKGVEFRPDLVSNDYYGFPDNWWRILEANKMMDIWEFKAGKTILLPKLTL